jgi:hypothetical protein
MKLLHTLFLLFLFSIGSAQQNVVKKGDTLYYNGEKFYKGLVVRFGSPSRDTKCTKEATGQETNEQYWQRLNAPDYYFPCKDFAFVWLGAGIYRRSASGAPAGYAGMEVEVIGFQNVGIGKSAVRCIVVDMLVHRNLPIGFFTNSRKEKKRKALVPEPYKSLSEFSFFSIDVAGAMDNKELVK